MLRKIIVGIDIAYVVLMLMSCATPVVIGDKLPAQESSRLFFCYGLQVTACNGIPVPVKKILGDSFSTWQDVTLPSGNMEFTLNVDCAGGNDRFAARNVSFKYTFDPQTYYSLALAKADDNTWGIAVHSQPYSRTGYPKNDNWIAFVPFSK